MILRLNLEIDVDDFTLLQFSALTDAISHACNVDRKRLRSIRQPKEKTVSPADHAQEQRETRKEILGVLRGLSENHRQDQMENVLVACREYLEAEEAAGAT